MVCPGCKAAFNAFLWVFLLTFLPKNHVTKGTGFDVFNQASSKEKYYPNYNLYHNLSKLNECIHDLVSRYPNTLDAEMRFRSRLGLSQYVLHFTNNRLTTRSRQNNSYKTKARILLSFGEHSAEYLPVESMLYLLDNLTAGLDDVVGSRAYNFTRFVLDNIDLYLIGMFNPDGRMIIEKTANYCWKETASQADVNAHGSGSSPVFSRQVLVEPECRVITELTGALEFDVIISVHSGEKNIFIPVQDNTALFTQPLYPDHSETLKLASLLSNSSPLGLKHTYLKASQYHHGESILSYASNTRRVPFTYLVSVWGHRKVLQKRTQNHCFAKYNPPSEQLHSIVESIHPIYAALFKYMVRWKKAKMELKADMERQEFKMGRKRRLSYTQVFFVFLIVIVIFLVMKFRMPLGWRLFYRRQRRIVSLRSLSSVFSFVFV